MRELRCALGDIFTRCGTTTTKKKNSNILASNSRFSISPTLSTGFEYTKPKIKKVESIIPNITYDVESGTERTLAFGITVKDVVWMIDRLNEFGYDVISVTQNSNIWKPRNEYVDTILIYTTPNHYYFKVRKIELEDLF